MNFEPRAGEIDLPWVGFCLTTHHLHDHDAPNHCFDRYRIDYSAFLGSVFVTPRLWLLASTLIGLPLYLWWQGAPSFADTKPKAAPVPGSSPAPHVFMGAGSCAAAACHNGNFAHGGTGSEYTTWITRDPHAKAYEVLFADAAKGMQKHLKGAVPAHEDRRCLQCHVAPGYDAAKHPSYFPTDGVSCESCHGPAQKWLNLHHLDAWQSLDRAAKKALGMNDTRALWGRAQVCTPCHVGTAGAH